jgi:cobalt-zinc-cadmium efflux system protein
VHDLHIWPMSTTEVVLTCHMVIPAEQPGDTYLMKVAHDLKEDFGIQRATLQVETDLNRSAPWRPTTLFDIVGQASLKGSPF